MINFFTDTYDNYLIMGGFNIEQSDPSLKAFLSSNKLYNLIKSNTFFKGKGSCIDLFLVTENIHLSLVAHMRQILAIIIK